MEPAISLDDQIEFGKTLSEFKGFPSDVINKDILNIVVCVRHNLEIRRATYERCNVCKRKYGIDCLTVRKTGGVA